MKLLSRIAVGFSLCVCLVFYQAFQHFVPKHIPSSKHMWTKLQNGAMKSRNISDNSVELIANHYPSSMNSESKTDTDTDYNKEAVVELKVNTNNTDYEKKNKTFLEFKNLIKTDPEFLRRVLKQNYLNPKSAEIIRSYIAGGDYSFKDEFDSKLENILQKGFDINEDVIIFLHIQKTGGIIFGNRVANELVLPFPCGGCERKTTRQPPCKCLNPRGNMWIYNSVYARFAAGLHPDWTSFHLVINATLNKIEGKVRQRRYFYITQLRDPFERYLSEWNHLNSGVGEWESAALSCGQFQNPSPGDVGKCFLTDTWKGVTLDGFMACPHNLATNRMSRMLADLSLSDCYRGFQNISMKKQRAMAWVDSAKVNLQTMEYFGLFEYTSESDELFERTFNLKFSNVSNKYHSLTSTLRLTETQFLQILQLIESDIHTYLFAKQLFHMRLSNLKHQKLRLLELKAPLIREIGS